MEVDATRGADHLGDDPLASCLATAAELTDAFREEGALARAVHHPAGYRTGAELLGIRVLDVAVHCWDLARAIDADDTLDADVVEFAWLWLQGSRPVASTAPSLRPSVRLRVISPLKIVCCTWRAAANLNGRRRHERARCLLGVDDAETQGSRDGAAQR